MSPPQQELELFSVSPGDPNVEWFVKLVGEHEWIKAADVLRVAGKPVNEEWKRWPRALRKAAAGRVVGHQKGYKLTEKMTPEEYNHWRNNALKQSHELKADVIETDRVFHGRKATG